MQCSIVNLTGNGQLVERLEPANRAFRFRAERAIDGTVIIAELSEFLLHGKNDPGIVAGIVVIIAIVRIVVPVWVIIKKGVSKIRVFILSNKWRCESHRELAKPTGSETRIDQTYTVSYGHHTSQRIQDDSKADH